MLLDGRDVTEEIRTPAISDLTSQVSADIGVRMALVRKQQAILEEGDWVAEGRDIGTVVCPDAEVKVFLTASPEVRAQRRAEELGARLRDRARRAARARRARRAARALAADRRQRRRAGRHDTNSTSRA